MERVVDDEALLKTVSALAAEFSRDRPASEPKGALRCDDLTLIWFVYATG